MHPEHYVHRAVFLLALSWLGLGGTGASFFAGELPEDTVSREEGSLHRHVTFDACSIGSGAWSDATVWADRRVPRAGDRVLVGRGTHVVYDVASTNVLRLVQVAGTLRFSRECDTLLEVGLLKVQNSEHCSESGFACDFRAVNRVGEPEAPSLGPALLEIGTLDQPIPASITARIRLHALPGLDANHAPALVCCAARMEIHGAPMSRTWVKLGADVEAGARELMLAEATSGWREGDEVLVTPSQRRPRGSRSFRTDASGVGTEVRRIESIDGTRLRLDRALRDGRRGQGEFRAEVANLSRNVTIESATPEGTRGHTLYHRYSRGSLSYARFAHLGKEGVLGRYAIHFHRVGDTMRGAQVRGLAIVDSHNRWITIHGTRYLVVRDCVGYQSVGHGFFLEDGTEIYNLLERNLGVQAFRGRRLPEQVLPFDPNDGAAFWWANGRNSFVANVACENDQYGFRYDSQRRSNFDSVLPVRQPDGSQKEVDIRTIPIFRFEGNEAHSEGLYGVAVAGTEGTGPDTAHPHVLRGLKLWDLHYALRAQLPTMLVEDVVIDHAAYGIYRPWFKNHVYRNLRIGHTNTEPFNRGLDDRSLQHGSITVDGLTFYGVRNSGTPLIQISANDPTGTAESHFRNVRVADADRGRRALVNLGAGPRLEPTTATSVPVFIHDYFGPGEHARVVSTRAKDFRPGDDDREAPPLTGDESRARRVVNVPFPQLLDPVDDLPPATVILSVRELGATLEIRGVSHDNGLVAQVEVEGVDARIDRQDAGVADWTAIVSRPAGGSVTAVARDAAGNVEQTPHTHPVPTVRLKRF